MKNDKISYHLVLNSLDTFYIFQLDTSGYLISKTYDLNYKLIEEQILMEGNTLLYSIALDNKGNIHLVILLKNGELHHMTYQNSTWIGSIIGKYDTKSNRYNRLEILFLNNKLNILYSYSNFINSNIFTIQHIIYDKKVEEQHNIIKYVSTKMGDPFVVDYDELGTIHLLYNTITNEDSYIYHCFYSPYRKSWSINPKELSNVGRQNMKPYLFIDYNSNIHSIWIELDNSQNYKIKYKQMPTKGKNKYIWNEVEIPANLYDDLSYKSAPILIETQGKINIAYNNLNEIKLISPSPDGFWSKDSVKVESNTIFRLTILDKLYQNLKARHLYGKLDTIPHIHIIDEIKAKSSPLDQSDLISNDIEIIKLENPKETTVEQIPLHAEEVIESIKKIKSSQEELLLLVNKILSQEEKIIDKLDQLQDTINMKQPSLFSKLFNKS